MPLPGRLSTSSPQPGSSIPRRGDVTRAEVELAEGGLFVLREGGRTIAATTGPNPTSGLVAYDLRTLPAGDRRGEAQAAKRATRKPKEGEGE